MPVVSINKEQFRSCLFVDIDKEYKKDLLFVKKLLYAAVDNYYNIIKKL